MWYFGIIAGFLFWWACNVMYTAHVMDETRPARILFFISLLIFVCGGIVVTL